MPSGKKPVSVTAAKRRAAEAIRRQDAEIGAAVRESRQDRWVNHATGQGTLEDKTRMGYFDTPWRLSDPELTNLVNGNDLAAKGVEKRPAEMFRQGYALKPGKGAKKLDQSSLDGLQAQGEELLVDVRAQQGMQFGRQYGGSILIMGIDDGRPQSAPVDEDNIRSIRFINQVDRRFSYVMSYYSDPGGGGKYGEPRMYLVANAVATQLERTGYGEDDYRMTRRTRRAIQKDRPSATVFNIHESRVIRFDGVETDVVTRQTLAGWSWSVLQRSYESLRQCDMSFDALAYLISDASQGVLELKGLLQAIGSGNKQALEQRLEVFEKTRSYMRGIALDSGAGEKFTRVTTPLTGIPDSIDRIMQRVAAAFDMPVTELFGISPAGLNATGESDRIKWYDTIKSEQTKFLAPKLRRLYRLLALAKDSPLRGKWQPIDLDFKPLYSPTDEEISKVRAANATRDCAYVEAEILTKEQVLLTLTDVYPSIDADAIEDEMAAKTAFDPYENDPLQNAPAQALSEGHPAVQGDPKPGGGLKVPVPKPPKPPTPRPIPGAAALQGAVQGAGGGEAQSPTIPLPNSTSSKSGAQVQTSGQGRGTPGDKADMVDPGPNVAEDLYNQLLKDFPASAVSWVLAAQVEGPKEVALNRIDFSTRDSWRATRQPDKVAKYAENLDKLAPVVLVDRRGSDLLDPVDGHHRILAYESKGLPVVAYVIRVQTKTGPWTNLHTEVQRTKGGDVDGSLKQGARTGRQSREGESNQGSRTDADRDENGRFASGSVSASDPEPTMTSLRAEGMSRLANASGGVDAHIKAATAHATAAQAHLSKGSRAKASEHSQTAAEHMRKATELFKAGVPDALQARSDDTHEHFAGEFEGMHDGGKEVRQSSSDKHEVYAGAVAAQKHQEHFMGKMAQDLGAHTVRLDKSSPGHALEDLNAGLDKKGPTIVIGGLKSEKRADEKATKENGGDWSRMGDLVRSTIAVDKVSEMKPMIDKLKERMSKEGITLARAPSDRFAKPLDGYRDVLLNVKYPNGHVGEIQLHVKPMLRAKENGGHELYEQSRTIRGNAEHEKREHTPEEKATIASNSAKSEALYGPAIEEARR